MDSAPEADRPAAENVSHSAAGDDGTGNATTATQRSSSVGTAALFLLLAAGGAVAAVTSWTLLNRYDAFFQIPKELASLDAMSATTEQMNAQTEALQAAKLRNTTLCLAMIGGTMAGLLGLAAALARKSFGWAVGGFLLGLVLGILFGAAGGFGEVLLDRQLKSVTGLDATLRTIFSHSVAWGGIGLAVGFTVAASAAERRRLSRSVIAALSAGVIGAAIYSPLASFLFPLAKPENVLPTGSGNRLFWTALPAALFVVAVGRAALPRRGKD